MDGSPITSTRFFAISIRRQSMGTRKLFTEIITCTVWTTVHWTSIRQYCSVNRSVHLHSMTFLLRINTILIHWSRVSKFTEICMPNVEVSAVPRMCRLSARRFGVWQLWSVREKAATLFSTITPAFLGRFLPFFHKWKQGWILHNYM